MSNRMGNAIQGRAFQTAGRKLRNLNKAGQMQRANQQNHQGDGTGRILDQGRAGAANQLGDLTEHFANLSARTLVCCSFVLTLRRAGKELFENKREQNS